LDVSCWRRSWTTLRERSSQQMAQARPLVQPSLLLPPDTRSSRSLCTGVASCLLNRRMWHRPKREYVERRDTAESGVGACQSGCVPGRRSRSLRNYAPRRSARLALIRIDTPLLRASRTASRPARACPCVTELWAAGASCVCVRHTVQAFLLATAVVLVSCQGVVAAERLSTACIAA